MSYTLSPAADQNKVQIKEKQDLNVNLNNIRLDKISNKWLQLSYTFTRQPFIRILGNIIHKTVFYLKKGKTLFKFKNRQLEAKISN